MTKKKKGTHGGKRAKAGRKPVDEALKAVTIAISITPARLAKLDEIAVPYHHEKRGRRSKCISALIDKA